MCRGERSANNGRLFIDEYQRIDFTYYRLSSQWFLNAMVTYTILRHTFESMFPLPASE